MPIKAHLLHMLRKLLFVWVQTRVQGSLPRPPEADKTVSFAYVLRDRSLSDLLVLDNECLQTGLPRPIPHQQSAQPAGSQGLCCFLNSPADKQSARRNLYSAPQLIRLLHQLQDNPDTDIHIIPVSIFWGRRPDKEKSALKLLFSWNYTVGHRFRKMLAVFFHGRQTMVHFNTAVSLRRLMEEGLGEERTLRKLHRILRVHFRQLHVAVNGPDLSHRRTLVKNLLRSKSVAQAVQHAARHSNMSQQKAELQARNYAQEIVSDYSHPLVSFGNIVLTWFWNKIYKGVDVYNAASLNKLAKSHSLVYLPCHRSHIDYMLLSWVLYHQGLQIPHIAAGINLNMPIAGSIMRKGGAFFIRRSFRGNQLYTTVFNEYLHTLFTRGFPVEFFIEGGRSRTGRTLEPKTGMLSIMLRSYLRDHHRPLALIPVYISYEKILESASYLNELRGQKKKKESLLDIARNFMALKENFGRARVNFGEPLLLTEFLNQKQPDWQNQDYEPQGFRPPWLRDVTAALGTRLAGQINAAAVINPVNLVATVLLHTPRQALGEEQLIKLLETLSQLLLQVSYSPYTCCPETDGRTLLAHVEELALVERHNDGLGTIIRLSERNAVLLTYYRNNILHLLALPSFICLLLERHRHLARDEVIRRYRMCYPYLQSELFMNQETDALDAITQQWLDALQQAGLLEKAGDTGLRCPDSGSPEFVTLTTLSRIIQQPLERFLVVISLLLRNGPAAVGSGELERQSRKLAQRLAILHGVNAPEFFDRTLFRNLVSTLEQQGVVCTDAKGKLVFDEQLAVIAKDYASLLPSEIQHSISQVTQLPEANLT